MATVDFTLEDIAVQTEAITSRIVEQALIKEREYTKRLIQEAVDEAITQRVPKIVTGQLMAFWDDVLEPALDDIHAEIGEVKHSVRQLTRVVNQHSRDIMDLRSRLAAS